NGRSVQVKLAGGGQPPGRRHEAPPSVDSQMPPPETFLKSSRAVASTTFGSGDPTETSIGRNVGKPSRCWKLLPPSKLRNRPPLSVPTTSRLPSDSATDTATARPPWSTLGGAIVTSLAQVQPDQRSGMAK